MRLDEFNFYLMSKRFVKFVLRILIFCYFKVVKQCKSKMQKNVKTRKWKWKSFPLNATKVGGFGRETRIVIEKSDEKWSLKAENWELSETQLRNKKKGETLGIIRLKTIKILIKGEDMFPQAVCKSLDSARQVQWESRGSWNREVKKWNNWKQKIRKRRNCESSRNLF